MTPVQRLNTLVSSFDLGKDGGQVQVLNWNYMAHLPDNLPHRHTFFEVCTVGRHGGGEFRVEGLPYPISSGDTFIARPGVIHQIVNTQAPNMELFWVCFSLDGCGQVARAFAQSDVLVKRSETVTALWQAVFTSATASFPGSNEMITSLASALLFGILGEGSDLPAQQNMAPLDFQVQQTQMAVRFIHDNLARPLPIAEIAAHVHISPRQLARLFARYIGTSPANYIEVARLDRAEALLLRSSLPLKSVAREVGYEDAAHFSRVFARRNGNPPGDFRRRKGALIARSSGANIQHLGELV